MTDHGLSYALITPARNEPDNLMRLAEAICAQDVLPTVWIVVDNGSTDATLEVALELERAHPWFRVTSSPAAEATPRPGAPVVRAFHQGLTLLDEPVDVVVKLDADVSFEPSYFRHLLAAFESQPRLGIASGTCMERYGDEWRPTFVTAGHVRGATRAYRWRCLQEVLPLEERVGWDGVDELKANVRGWETGIIPGLSFLHHRRLGARDGSRFARWVRQGEGAHFMGYGVAYLALRTLHRSRQDPAAVAMLWGFVRSALRREPRLDDAAVRAHLRRRQRLRNLPKRAVEALGRRSS